MSKRGNPTVVSPEVMAEMERLYCQTTLTFPQMVAAIDNPKVNASYVRNQAKRLGWNRPKGAMSKTDQRTIEQRAFDRSWLRYAKPVVRDNPVVKVAPGTHKVARFSMIGGNIRWN